MWLEPSIKGQNSWRGPQNYTAKVVTRTVKTGATLATCPVGSHGILIFKACDRYFQIALWEVWTSSTNCMRLHGFPVLWLLADSGGGLWLSTFGCCDWPPVLRVFSLGWFFPAEWLQSCPRLCPHIPFIRSSAHLTLYMFRPHLTSLECSVIRKSSFPAVLESAGVYCMSLPPTPVAG